MHTRPLLAQTAQANPRSPRDTTRGFTLIELIVAISILALVAVLGWRGLDGIVRARISLNAEMEETRAMQLTFAQLQSDAAHLAPASLMSTRPLLLAMQDRLLLVRLIFAEQQPMQVQIVDYRLHDGVLTRTESTPTRDLNTLDAMWQSALNNAGNSEPQTVILQSHIAALQIQLWDSQARGWRPANAIGSQNSSTNWKGLQVALQLRGHSGNIVKTFLLGGV